MKQFVIWQALISVILFLSGCTLSRQAAVPAVPSSDISGLGISGLSRVDDQTCLAVHDALGFENGPRLSLITIAADSGPVFKSVVIDDWLDAGGRSSDLESVCRIPSRNNEFLLAESGSWQGREGRLFHIRLDTAAAKAVVLGVTRLPVLADNSPDLVGDQYEGMFCLERPGNTLLVVIGERGGSASYRSGVLRWGVLDLELHRLTFTSEGMRGLAVDAPGKWADTNGNRDIADLYVDDDGIIWASACEDPGDTGPFLSVIFRLGRVTDDPDGPVRKISRPVVWRALSGLKVEALSSSPRAMPLGLMSIGTDDEHYGGIWRAIR
jgi:hypothetical protein